MHVVDADRVDVPYGERIGHKGTHCLADGSQDIGRGHERLSKAGRRSCGFVPSNIAGIGDEGLASAVPPRLKSVRYTV